MDHIIQALQIWIPLPVREITQTLLIYDVDYQKDLIRDRLLRQPGLPWFPDNWWTQYLLQNHWADVIDPWIEAEIRHHILLYEHVDWKYFSNSLRDKRCCHMYLRYDYCTKLPLRVYTNDFLHVEMTDANSVFCTFLVQLRII